MEELSQLQKEWVLINASKELLSLVKKRPNVSYEDAIKFARNNAEEVFAHSNTGLLRKNVLDKLYDKYKQEAKAKSIEIEKEIEPESLIEKRIEELNNLLSIYPKNSEDPDGLRKEKVSLEKILKDSKKSILGLERITENQAILKDAFTARVNKVFVNSHLGKYNQYVDKDNGSIFRINILHPNPAEAIVGADLIYEQYDTKKEKVRIAAIQYKVWEKEVLYISQAGNILKQLNNMEECFCKKEFCEFTEEMSSRVRYRLPYCAAFLRSTDKLQDPQKLITSGYHVPVCCLESIRKEGDYKIDLDSIKKYSLKSQSFEELFNAEMAGSKWLEIKELQSFYRESNVIEPTQRIILYAQNAVA